MAEWQTIDSAPNQRPVMTRIDDENGVRNEQAMTRRDRLWFIEARHGQSEMYVYYQPTHWREL